MKTINFWKFAGNVLCIFKIHFWKYPVGRYTSISSRYTSISKRFCDNCGKKQKITHDKNKNFLFWEDID